MVSTSKKKPKKREYTNPVVTSYIRPHCGHCFSYKVKSTGGGREKGYYYAVCDDCNKRTKCQEIKPKQFVKMWEGS
jgi:transcription elongation factor Elf1